MKTITLRLFFFTLIFILAVPFASPALAHGDEPRLEISSDRMNPGGVIEVRGVDFEFEEVVALALIGSEVEIPLGEIVADTEGVFLQIVTLPIDLKEGLYQFRAVTDDHQILSPELLVQGHAISNEEGGHQGQREEDDGLLVPMPTFAPSASPGVAPEVSQGFVVEVEDPGLKLPTFVTAAIAFILAMMFLVVRRRKNL